MSVKPQPLQTAGAFLPVLVFPSGAPLIGAGAEKSPAEAEYFLLAERLLLPLLRTLERLEDDRCAYGLTLVLPPLLLHAFADAALNDRLALYLQERITQAEGHLPHAAKHHPEAARQMLELRRDRLHWFDRQYSRRFAPALQRLAAFGNLELAVSTATPCALPLLRAEPAALRAQILVACDAFCETFGQRPHTIALPENAFFPGLETILAGAGLHAFLIPPAGLANASAPLPEGPHTPLIACDGLVAYALHPETSAQLDSAKNGYYLDHHYQASATAEASAEPPKRRDGKAYDRKRALHQADQHADHYLHLLQKQLAPGQSATVELPAATMAREWSECSAFLDYLFRKMHYDQDKITATTPTRYASDLATSGRPLQQAVPGECCSLQGDAFSAFFDGNADALLPELHLAAGRLKKAAGDPRILRQMARELLLAQIWTGGLPTEQQKQSTESARRHLARFCTLERMLPNTPDEATLAALEATAAIFPFLDTRHFQG